MNVNGLIGVAQATDAYIKEGTNAFYPVAAAKQHQAVFYGLAKAAGEDMASSSNIVGTYTDAAKTAIRSMLGAVGTTDYGDDNHYGLVRSNASLGFSIGGGVGRVSKASDA